MPEQAMFWWWDDAVREANARAARYGVRMRVLRFGGLWRVEPGWVRSR